VLVLLISAAACATEVTGDERASTGAPPPAPENCGELGCGEEVTPPDGDGGTDTPPVATDKCVDDEELTAADGTLHLEPGGCDQVDDTSKCCLDTTGTKWICTGGDEFPGVTDIHDYASYACPGL
jgi:hypothetical protein